MLWSFAIWAAVPIIGNGDTAALVFFGAFLVTALAGMPSIDAKMAANNPDTWPGLRGRIVHPALRRHPGRAQQARPQGDRLDRAAGRAGALGLLHAHRQVLGVPALIIG